jgi:hypothetical protein
VNKWSDSKYTIYGTYKENWDADVTLDMDKEGKIIKVVVHIGGV